MVSRPDTFKNIDGEATVSGAPAKKKAVKAQVGSALGLAQDDLSRKQLQRLYGYTAAQLKVDPSLFNLFQRAFAGQWDRARFESELEQIDWYRKNASSVRTYMLLEAEGGADFRQKKLDTQEAVRAKALKMGVNLSNERITELAEDSMMFGWGEQGREHELDKAISESKSEGGQYGGDIQLNVDNLKAAALANGVSLDESWYRSKAKSIAAGLALPEDVEREVRKLAAEKTPGFGAQIMAGQNLDALVSPWRRMMADEWEVAPEAIGLNDPMLRTAIGGFTDDGKPAMMDLGTFQQKLREDPRWANTDQAQNKATNSYAEVLKMFGMGN